MDVLNDDCIFELLKWLNAASLLLFGATSTRFRALVSRHIMHYGIGDFALDTLTLPQVRELLGHFGQHVIRLSIDFGVNVIDMEMFQDVDGCLINRAQSLQLRSHLDLVVIDEYDGYFRSGPYIDEIRQQTNRFLISAENIVTAINGYQLPSLKSVSFECQLRIKGWASFDHLCGSLSTYIRPGLVRLFVMLRRGHMTIPINFNHQQQTIDIIFELNL